MRPSQWLRYILKLMHVQTRAIQKKLNLFEKERYPAVWTTYYRQKIKYWQALAWPF
jgi:hypothetical protein